MSYITDKELARRLAMSVSGVRAWRQAGKGPPWVKLDGHIVRYDEAAVEEWIAKQPKAPSPTYGDEFEIRELGVDPEELARSVVGMLEKKYGPSDPWSLPHQPPKFQKEDEK